MPRWRAAGKGLEYSTNSTTPRPTKTCLGRPAAPLCPHNTKNDMPRSAGGGRPLGTSYPAIRDPACESWASTDSLTRGPGPRPLELPAPEPVPPVGRRYATGELGPFEGRVDTTSRRPPSGPRLTVPASAVPGPDGHPMLCAWPSHVRTSEDPQILEMSSLYLRSRLAPSSTTFSPHSHHSLSAASAPAFISAT